MRVDDGAGTLILNNAITLPIITDKDTWNGDAAKCRKMALFQLAFILLNLKSMSDRFPVQTER